MKHKFLLTGLMLLFGLSLSAQQSGTCGDNLTWTLEDGTLTISGTGEMDNYLTRHWGANSIFAPWNSHRSSITLVIIEEGVTFIGEFAFEDCSNLISVTFPNSVTSIGGDAFSGCSGLTSIEIPNSVTSIGSSAFYYCRSLTSVTISNSVTSIGGSAFSGCSGLTSIEIPNSVTSIGNNAFSCCSGLSSIEIPNSVTSIGSGAFSKCTGLTSVTIPNSVTSIGDWAFQECGSLTSIQIPNSVTDIGWYVFQGCSGLIKPIYSDSIFVCMPTSYSGSYIIPNGIKKIAGYAFDGCSSLTSVTIPNSVTSIGHGAFFGCSGLTSVSIPNSVTSIEGSVFPGSSSLPIKDNLRYADTYLVGATDKTLSDYKIKDGTKWIGSSAFSGCSNLISVTIPNSVMSIEDRAFYNCSSLTSVTIPDGVTNIGDGAFYNCSGLTSVTIPNSVTSIGDGAFSGCSGLTSVTIPNSVTSIGGDAFSGCSSLPIKDNLRYADTYLIGATDKTLSDYKIKDGTKWIGSSAFSGCSNFISVTIPNSVMSIEDRAFYNCSSLTSVIIPNNVRSIGYGAFSDCSSLTSVIIPNSVTSIGDGAFYNCSGLTSVTIPNSVTSIGDDVFSGCSSLPIKDNLRYADTYLIGATDKTLSDYKIKDGTKWIGSSAFSGCNRLTSVIIPNCVTNIGNYAFYNCSRLKSVTMESSTPVSVGSNVFQVTIYVPLGSLNAYRATKWKNYNLRVFDTSAIINDGQPTSAVINLSASLNGESKNKYITACGVTDGEEFSGNVVEYTGLEPESEYNDMQFYFRTTKGDILTVTASFTTPALTLTTLAAKAVSDNTAILLAETNMSDAETSCGFEWRRNDQPEDMPSNQVLCPVANNLLAGRLKGLKDNVYYKYRAFYKSAAGNMYYGDWQYIFTGDVAVEFDPVLYTYAAQYVTEHDATLKGYALPGADDFSEQGFEYWADSRKSASAPRRAPHDAIGEHRTVAASGISMRVTLQNLDEGTVYKYRTYAKVGEQTIYGSEMSFTTEGEYIEYTLTAVSADNTTGSVTGGGIYHTSTKVSIEAVPETGYLFVEWSDGSKANPRIVTMTENLTFTAYFESQTPSALDEVQEDQSAPRKVMRDGVMYVLMPDGRMYDLQGKEVR